MVDLSSRNLRCVRLGHATRSILPEHAQTAADWELATFNHQSDSGRPSAAAFGWNYVSLQAGACGCADDCDDLAGRELGGGYFLASYGKRLEQSGADVSARGPGVATCAQRRGSARREDFGLSGIFGGRATEDRTAASGAEIERARSRLCGFPPGD